MNEIVTADQSALDIEAYGGTQVQTSLAVNLARAEIDQQIATARALPRVLSRVVSNIQTLATLDEESAAECIYALPRGGKPIKGPSIRLAEIIGSQWGNARVGARVVHVDRAEKFVEAEGVFHDLETNMATTSRVRRRISDKKGQLLTDDMIIVTGNAACSIAKRNAILGAVPKAVWRKAYQTIEQVIAGDIKTLSERREKAMKAFAVFGATPEQVLSALGLTNVEDVTLEHMPILAGMHSSLKSGEATVEEMFQRGSTHAQQPANLKNILSQAKEGAAPNIVEHIDREVASATQQNDKPATERASPSPSEGSHPATHSPSEGGGDENAITKAYDEGAAAFASGKPLTELPGAYRDAAAQALADAWENGWQDKNIEDKEGA